ncbi:uncharacterized protein QC761_119480 [Podospora bellae-mahoneyi]|uniref:Autophagy-related protein 29 n=1 Tax=Podospora bellae-mahoneyi TaxID=2093777 RepID=A0ABR0G1D7_9PEZI|nr:hypothetical protein QC761_119480 [Podospora bellae-mahoneyi]
MEEQRRQREGRAPEPKETKGQASVAQEPKYLLYIRLPIKRGDFVDPPLMDWNEEKSNALWSIISDNSRSGGNINFRERAVRAACCLVDEGPQCVLTLCAYRASQFEVTVDFLIQMANYLTDRHASQIRAQMLKAATGRGSAAPSPIPGAEPSSHTTHYPQISEPPRRTGSASGRAPSSLSMRNDRKDTPSAPLPRQDTEYATTVGAGPSAAKPTTIPLRPAVSRNSSAGTTIPTQTQLGIRPAPSVTSTRSTGRYMSSFSYQQREGTDQDDTSTFGAAQPSVSASPAASESEEESDSDNSPVQSRIIRRPPRFSVYGDHRAGFDGLAEEDEDEPEPAFLPPPHQQQMDLGATLRGAPVGVTGGGEFSQTSDSSASSAAIVHRPGTALAAGGGRYPVAGQDHIHGTLSPRSRTAELREKGKGGSREGSDGTGTPSMGSSFSDLDGEFLHHPYLPFLSAGTNRACVCNRRFSHPVSPGRSPREPNARRHHREQDERHRACDQESVFA